MCRYALFAPRALCWRTIALFLVNLFTYTTSITTSTVLLVLALALVLAMVSALFLVELVTCSQKGHVNLEWLDGRGSPPVLVFGGETNAFGGKIYYTNSNAKTMISLCPVCGVQYISVAEFHTHTNSNDNTIISPFLVCGVQ